MQQEHQVVVRALLLLHGLGLVGKFRLGIGDHPLVEGAHGFLIPQSAVAQPGQQAMLLPALLLGGGKIHGQQVLPRGAGKAALEYGHIFLVFLLGQAADGLGKAGDHPAVPGEVAAAQEGRVAPVGIQAAAQLGKITLIHHSVHLVAWKIKVAGISVP